MLGGTNLFMFSPFTGVKYFSGQSFNVSVARYHHRFVDVIANLPCFHEVIIQYGHTNEAKY